MDEFCASADLYCSIEHLRSHIDLHQLAGSVTDLVDAGEFGREVWGDVPPSTSTLADRQACWLLSQTLPIRR